MNILLFLITIFENFHPFIQAFFLFVMLIYIYHFIVFYCWQPPRKKFIFWQITIFLLLFFVSYYIIKYFCQSYYTNIFENFYMQKFRHIIWLPMLKKTYYLLALIPFTELFKKFSHYIFKNKNIKHGAIFTPTKTKKGNGIEISNFDLKVLPKHIREFSHKSSHHLFLPYNRLSRTTTILGDMGCGKSRLLYLIEKDLREHYPDIPILIHDPKGEWLRTLYNPDTDLIFAPFDKRTFAWDIINDFKTHPELIHSLVATAVESHQSGQTDRFWSDSAIELLKDSFRNSDSIEKVKIELRTKMDSKEGDKTFQSQLATALLGFRDIVTIALTSSNKVLSIEDIINHKGRIFLLNNPACASEQLGSLSLMLSAFFMQTISMADMPTTDSLRVAVIIDEALTFNLPNDIERGVYTQCRSKGLAIFAASQRLPQKEKHERGAWADNPNHLIAMRVGDMPTREMLSKRIGTMTYDERQESFSFGEKSSSLTHSKVQRQHAVLLPEDFGNLKNRQIILFHEDGVGVGTVLHSPGDQQNNIKPLDYQERRDVSIFMRGL